MIQQTRHDFSGKIHFEFTAVILHISLRITTVVNSTNHFVLSKVINDRFYPEANARIDAITVLLLIQYNTSKNKEISDERSSLSFLLDSLRRRKKNRTSGKEKVALLHKI